MATKLRKKNNLKSNPIKKKLPAKKKISKFGKVSAKATVTILKHYGDAYRRLAQT